MNIHKKLFIITLLTLLLISLNINILLKAEDKEITVAYIDYNNFITENNDKTFSGYAVDYLNTISTYTGWKYQFINTYTDEDGIEKPLDWITAQEKIRNKEIDFYCVARQMEEREQIFDFSLYPVCNEEMNLYVLKSSEYYYEDFKTLNNKKIGVLQNSGEKVYFEKYAEEHNFDYTIKEFDSNKKVIQALNDHLVDAIAIVNYSSNDDLKLIGNIGVSPAYMMSYDNSELMALFNKAQERLYFSNPNYIYQLKDKYYSNTDKSNLNLTREEHDYISNLTTPLNVAISYDMAPIEFLNVNSYQGVTIDLYEQIGMMTGLKFTYVKRGTANELLEDMENDRIQLVGTMSRDSKIAEVLNVKQTIDFMDSSYSIVSENISKLTNESIIATPAPYPAFKSIAEKYGYSKFKEYDTIEECVNAVYKGNSEATFILSTTTNYLLDHVEYSNLKSIILNDSTVKTCFGVSVKTDPRLYEIMNKCLSTFTTEDINQLIVSNISRTKPKQTFLDFYNIYETPIYIGIVLLIIAISIILFIHAHNKQRNAISDKDRLHHKFLEHLYNTIPCGIFQYEFEKPHKLMNYNQTSANIYGYTDDFNIIGKDPSFVIPVDYSDEFQEKFDLCLKELKPISYNFPIIKKDGTTAYVDCVMDVVDTEKGKIFQEIFTDVTLRIKRDKEIEKRYLQELNRENNNNLYATMCLNITKQEVISSTFDLENIKVGMKLCDFLDVCILSLKGLQNEEWINKLKDWFTIENAEKAYENGNFEETHVFCIRHDNELQWLEGESLLRRHPDGDLLCFIYYKEITKDKIKNDIMNQMVYSNYDCFICIDIATKKCYQYELINGILSYSKAVYGNDDLIIKHLNNNDFLEKIQLNVVLSNLEKDNSYQVFTTIYNNKRMDKALKYNYLNKEQGIISLTISDVTEAKRSEVEHAELLKNALDSAEKAGQAKSQFLSRVSHEMRTPLNAIIGFIELAKGQSREKMETYLASSDMAAKQLLNVINDVLDMSSIESGKLKIANAPFNFKHVLSSITNIYGTQCKQKGLNFETKILNPTEEWINGDELRINQILMNLLGNAIKFTNEGSIILKISQTNIENDRVFLRFEVIDSGCGMSEEMKKRLFKPFEQESATTAKKYGGNGLGLSIVKNLVSMMNGEIKVESTLGVGTKFIVDLPFEKCKVEDALGIVNKVETINVLVIDDEENERNYMSSVLKRMSVKHTCIGNGKDAVTEFDKAIKRNEPYTVCIIDWKMPDFSGYDTTSALRDKYGNDVVVIVVSAYDFEQAAENAKKAGANLFISKPIFQSSLFDLFMTITNGKIAEKKDDKTNWDFTGRRVLIAEDNSLNQIVVKGYLKKFNVVCDIAANGKIALDKFLESSEDYYDAILMDIQMPEMDGFEATRLIRESKHPRAKTINIIAQTADAFIEDIAKALSSGMNQHVSKPINPGLLGKALNQAFNKQ